jgi:SAM-dependent methyltransferase
VKHHFKEKYASLQQWHWWFRGRQRILERVLCRELNGRHSISIASLGCGPAEGLLWLTKLTAPAGRILGLEYDLIHARHAPPEIEYVIGDIASPPLAGSSFDAVLVLDVLEHLDDDTTGLREASQLVKPGGLLLVTVPALPNLWGGQDVVSDHRRRYTKSTLLEVFKRAALPIPRVTYFNTFLFMPVAGARWARRAMGLGQRSRSDFDDIRPGFVNEMLAAIFSAEQYLIPHMGMPVGVSLLAVSR